MASKVLNIEVPGEIRSLSPYPPGKPIEELERELGLKGSIKLASNENPLGPSKKAVSAVKNALKNLNRYPDGSCFYLKERLSRFLGFSPDSLVTGNGSNEIIELLVRTFLGRGDEAVMGEPSFAVYPLAVQAAGGRPIRVPLKDFTLDLEGMAERVSPRTRLIFIANPNNPTGTIVKKGELERFMDRVPTGVIVCMDEAYREFATSPDFPDSLGYVREGRAVIVLRTFSKIYGLAGLRVGYGVTQPVLVDFLNRVRQPFNVNSLAQAAAIAALDDTGHVEKVRKNNILGLKYLFAELKKLGCGCVPTEANFFLMQAGDGEALYNALLKQGVIVRPLKSYGLGEYIRVTVGTPKENRRFIETLRSIKNKNQEGAGER
ncbi:MAG: histidinol-phosphate transaminase [Deltaproteobacteria bacterium]|nr:histidinol-phosphate transaminase [Deltaproteobacteria bacterium]